MSNFLANIFKGGAEGILSGANKIIDNLVTNKEEKEQLKNKFTALVADYAKTQEEQVTERLKADMSSDSWMAKNIRPLSTAFSFIVISIFAVTDGNIGEFQINESYVILFKGVLLTQIGFYFGSRFFEKAIDKIKNK